MQVQTMCHYQVLDCGKNSSHICCHKQAVYGDKCVDISTVRWWVWQFKQEEVGEASLCDIARLVRPVTVTDKSHQEQHEK